MESILTKKQTRTETKIFTADIDQKAKNGQWVEYSGGCQHDEIVKHFPDLAHLVKWHLCSTDGPLHYIANALYWAGFTEYKDARNIENLESTIIWGSVSDDRFKKLDKMNPAQLINYLNLRLPLLMANFKDVITSIGFNW